MRLVNYAVFVPMLLGLGCATTAEPPAEEGAPAPTISSTSYAITASEETTRTFGVTSWFFQIDPAAAAIIEARRADGSKVAAFILEPTNGNAVRFEGANAQTLLAAFQREAFAKPGADGLKVQHHGDWSDCLYNSAAMSYYCFSGPGVINDNMCFRYMVWAPNSCHGLW